MTGGIEALKTAVAPVRFDALMTDLRAAAWVVYAKRPYGGPAQALAYPLLALDRRCCRACPRPSGSVRHAQKEAAW
jgi:hypothetical protein